MDPFLDVFIQWVEDNKSVSLSITLVVDGQVIQGDLASAKLHQESMTDALLGSQKEFVRALGEGLKKGLEQGREKEKTEEQLLSAAEHVHLLDAEVTWGNGTCNVGPLRLRKEKISAWSLGRAKSAEK